MNPSPLSGYVLSSLPSLVAIVVVICLGGVLMSRSRQAGTLAVVAGRVGLLAFGLGLYNFQQLTSRTTSGPPASWQAIGILTSVLWGLKFVLLGVAAIVDRRRAPVATYGFPPGPPVGYTPAGYPPASSPYPPGYAPPPPYGQPPAGPRY